MELRKSTTSIQGVLHLPLALGLGITAMTCLSFLAIGNYWVRLVRTQLALDRCTGEKALELRQRLRILESTNQKIRFLRLSATAALAAGNLPTFETLRRTSAAVARLQDLELLGWRKTQAQWWASSACRGSVPRYPLPEIPFLRPKADPLGERPLDWKEGRPRSFRITLKKGNRRSESFVFQAESHTGSQWTASWRQPHATVIQ